ncbi:ankyrin repeat domain-containing protein [Aureibaculum sp. A20]|uniref:Ankyrin repeat domain-containing protein n=1 Tax=Aureibaculum flavum TaxID=2795986 RepID=A0ABS0WVX0_9FLAO|nr:ankyrin repeat domain-containing protein [Aureibaculum flavum]MBJ2176144.1 ankyrin repeat domain-containing protein [Aureibaculum flavum]
MKKYFTIILLVIASTITAQQTNIFWSRDFWKPTTTIADVVQQVKAGNDATALSSSNFDATVNAILANASDDVIKHLLSYDGNDVNKITHDGRTYLFWAGLKGNLPVMKHLISNGAKTDILDDKGSTVLLFAAGGGQTNPELYNLLLANGATINETNPKGANALHQLIGRAKNLNELDYFIKKGLKLSATDKSGLNTIDYAARSGNKEIIELLIKKGISYKDTNSDGGNAFLEAATVGRGGGNSLAFFKYLEGLGISPNITNKKGVNPIHKLASGNKDKAIFDYFIEKGVDPTKADSEGNTALINAAGRNNLEIITYFVDKNVAINAKNKVGKSALTNAVAANSPDVVSFLINKGADINSLDKDNNNLAYYLVDSYSKRNIKQFNEKWDLLTKKGLEMLHIQKENNNLMHLAVTKNDTDLLDKIANIKVDINAKNSNGLTPLHIAAMTTDNAKIIKHLISLGAKSSVLTDFEESAYDLALENEFLNKNTIEFLKL